MADETHTHTHINACTHTYSYHEISNPRMSTVWGIQIFFLNGCIAKMSECSDYVWIHKCIMLRNLKKNTAVPPTPLLSAGPSTTDLPGLQSKHQCFVRLNTKLISLQSLQTPSLSYHALCYQSRICCGHSVNSFRVKTMSHTSFYTFR